MRLLRFSPILLLIAGALFFCAPAWADSHFKQTEFACKHCGKVKVNPVLITKLEALRAELGDIPIVITSGYRCPIHNKAIGGVKNSQHTHGMAADIKAAHYTSKEVAHFAKMIGFGYVKVYKSWVHVDVRGE